MLKLLERLLFSLDTRPQAGPGLTSTGQVSGSKQDVWRRVSINMTCVPVSLSGYDA